MNIVFGLCGNGKRFRDAGYAVPKYLIDVMGKPMIHHAVKTLKIPGRIYFVVRQDHLRENETLASYLLTLGHELVVCPGETEGAAQSLLLTKDHIKDQDAPFISVNCDQYLDWDSSDFIAALEREPDTSFIMTFKENDPKCSYIRKDANGYVAEAREKKVISDDATVGVYHWAKTSDFFRDAEAMIAEGHKENNEYYVAPVYNYSIARGLKVKNYEVTKKQFCPIGTPNDLDHFLKNYYNEKIPY